MHRTLQCILPFQRPSCVVTRNVRNNNPPSRISARSETFKLSRDQAPRVERSPRRVKFAAVPLHDGAERVDVIQAGRERAKIVTLACSAVISSPAASLKGHGERGGTRPFRASLTRIYLHRPLRNVHTRTDTLFLPSVTSTLVIFRLTRR